MRFMILVKATKDSEAGKMPSPQLLADMGKFNQELIAAGVMLDGGGLHPTSKGARVTFSGKERTVTRGPFAHVDELVSGYWIWKLNSLEEAIDWVKRCGFCIQHREHMTACFIACAYELMTSPPCAVAQRW